MAPSTVTDAATVPLFGAVPLTRTVVEEPTPRPAYEHVTVCACTEQAGLFSAMLVAPPVSATVSAAEVASGPAFVTFTSNQKPFFGRTRVSEAVTSTPRSAFGGGGGGGGGGGCGGGGSTRPL